MAVLSVIFLLILVRQALAEDSCNSKEQRSEYGSALLDHVYHSFSADHLSSCVVACNTQPPCQSSNYNLDYKICHFNNNTKEFRPKYFVKRAFSVYANSPNSESASWNKLNTIPVCFGAKDNQFGKFQISIGGSVKAVKLVHVSGEVSCHVNWGAEGWTKFGCTKTNNNLLTVITTANDEILLPESQQIRYTLPGYHPDSEEIVFSDISPPLLLSSGEELRIWHGEDLDDYGDGNNDGSSCVDVYAKYI